jgi:hypothetical protein
MDPKPSPQPMPRWMTTLPPCACGMCPDPPEEVPTPFHPSALQYRAIARIAARRAADEEWYARQCAMETRRNEELAHFARRSARSWARERSPIAEFQRDQRKNW